MVTFQLNRSQWCNIIQFAGFMTLLLIAAQQWIHVTYQGQWFVSFLCGCIGSGLLFLKRQQKSPTEEKLCVADEKVLYITYWIICISTFLYTSCYLVLVAYLFFYPSLNLIVISSVICCSFGVVWSQQKSIKEKILR